MRCNPGVHRSWIFPRDPQFAEKAGRVLDLYARTWDGTTLGAEEFVISADEKPSLQRAAASMRRWRPARLVRCASNTSTSGPVR